MDGYLSKPFTQPVTIIPAVAPATEILSDRPLYARISTIRWYDQYYWPFVLDLSEGAQRTGSTGGGYYDRLLVDKNRDGDMTDPGEVIVGRYHAGEAVAGQPHQGFVFFDVGELQFVDRKREDSRFPITEMVMMAEANLDPVVAFRTTFHHKMFDSLEYSLSGPRGKEMRFSADPTDWPTLNITPEIVAAPDFYGKEIRLTLVNPEAPFTIGESRRLEMECRTGDPEKNDYVLTFQNSSFEPPILGKLIYTTVEERTGVMDFELGEWEGDYGFAGRISIPEDAAPGTARLLVNFSETGVDDGRVFYTHFTQVVPYGTPYVDGDGMEITPVGWETEIEIVR